MRGNVLTRAILTGARPIIDLEVACRVCNTLHYLKLKFGEEIAGRYKIIWI